MPVILDKARKIIFSKINFKVILALVPKICAIHLAIKNIKHVNVKANRECLSIQNASLADSVTLLTTKRIPHKKPQIVGE